MEYKLAKSKTSKATRKQDTSIPDRSQSSSHHILDLQRTIGNRAVLSMIQAKLQVNQPGDVYEQEADNVAKYVMTMPTHQVQPTTQRQATPKEKDRTPVQIKPASEPRAQRQVNSGEIVEASEDIEQQLGQSNGKGDILPDHVRSFMEPRFGIDFSEVRVHTGNEAIQMNNALSAQAFTVGPDIYYGSGKSPSDLELTAHELTHVVQQGGAGVQSNDTESSDAVKGQADSSYGDLFNVAQSRSAPSSLNQGLSRRMIQRRGVPIPGGAIPTPAPTNSVDGTRVVTKLNQMGFAVMPTRGTFDGFNGTLVERQIVNAFETSNLQPRSIAINFLDERGINKIWTGTINIRMENSTPVQDSGGTGTGTITGGGGGTGTSGTTASSTSTTGGSGEASGEISSSGSKGGGKGGGSTSTTTTQGESQGASGASTTGASTTDRIQRYQCTIIADIFLKCELDVSGTDYANPFKWGAYIREGIDGPYQMFDSVDCGQWTYQVSTGFATPTP